MPSSTPADREPARTDEEAKKRFLRRLQLSLSCVSPSAVWVVAPDLGRDGQWNAITAPDLVELRRQDGGSLSLRSTIGYSYADDDRWGTAERKVSTVEYAHTVGSEGGSLKPQLYSWEWSMAEPKYPHVHVRRGHPVHGGLGKLHIPTGRVFLEYVLLFLIQEHNVVPKRDDWFEVLGESFRRVSTYATWGGNTPEDLTQ